MADTSRGLIKYTSRDYNSIMEEFWEIVPKLTELWKPEADADPGVVLGKILASAADMLGVNVDQLANELYAPSVQQRKNAERLFSLIGYSLGWYVAARTEVTFKNANAEGGNSISLDFGFNGDNFSTVKATTDITDQPRVITYNILPMTNSYGMQDSRSRRETVTGSLDIFTDSDRVTLQPGESVTRVAIEGHLRNISISVSDVKANNYIITLPSQHIDRTAVWLKAKSNLADEFLRTRWTQVDTTADFADGEPCFCVTYDNYGNAQLQVSTVLNQLENYEENIFVVYWFDCSGVIGCVAQNVLQEYEQAIPDSVDFGAESLRIINLSNTIEQPHTHTVTGKSPETAKEAYYNSRQYINTWDSLITLPDFNRFMNREAGVDSAFVIDCQKALEINLAIYKNGLLTDEQKRKQYITELDFPKATVNNFNWRNILADAGVAEKDLEQGTLPFECRFSTMTAVCYLVHNDFNDATDYMPAEFVEEAPLRYVNQTSSAPAMPYMNYTRYKPPVSFLDGVVADYRGLQAMSVDLQFGYARVFPWYVVGEIYPKTPVSASTASVIIAKVKEALALYFSAANRKFGQKPTVMEVVEVVENADDNIRYFDAGALKNPVINWGERRDTGNGQILTVQYDIDYFNPISFARYKDVGAGEGNIRIAPDYVIG
ncbi:hypothetical protein [Ruminococcus sp.]|uniref:hypothetical protein n=1 Tax=Ruminococcus sp. TaxID=41978 RepID=UPI001B53D1C5|nr:hypothetical protein [Ruminococcus sp.]MBP5433652.1 hypothetical protein [Ruminococcus sp.]